MKTRNFALCALGLAAAISIGSVGTASAQAKTTTSKAASDTTKKKTTTRKKITTKKSTPAKSSVSIPVTKETAAPMQMHDTVRVMVHDTVQLMGRVDTVVRTVERYRVDTMMQMLPKQRLPGKYFGLAAGFAVPMNSFRDYNHDGPDLNAQLGWFPKDGALGIRVDGNYSLFPKRESGPCLAIVGTAGPTCQDTHIISGSADLVLRFPLDRTSVLNPVVYFLGGGGIDKISNFNAYKNTDGTIVTADAGPSKSEGTKFDYNAGGGVEFNLWGAHLFTEARYTAINTNGGTTHYIPVLFGLHFY